MKMIGENILDFVEWVFYGAMKLIGLIVFVAFGLLSVAFYLTGLYLVGCVLSWVFLMVLTPFFEVNTVFFINGFAIFFTVGMLLVNIPRDRPVTIYKENQ